MITTATCSRKKTDSAMSRITNVALSMWGNIQFSSETIAQPFTFTTREWDSDSGLYYYRARYMDATVGRFTGRFTVRDKLSKMASLPLSQNKYIYCDNCLVLLVGPLWKS